MESDRATWRRLRSEYCARFPRVFVAEAVRTAGFHRRRAESKRGLKERFTPWEWLDKCASFDFGCACCGKDGYIEVHHRQPLGRGGTNTIDNVEPLCGYCHQAADYFLGSERFRDCRERMLARYMEQLRVMAPYRAGVGVLFPAVKTRGEQCAGTIVEVRHPHLWAAATAIVAVGNERRVLALDDVEVDQDAPEPPPVPRRLEMARWAEWFQFGGTDPREREATGRP